MRRIFFYVLALSVLLVCLPPSFAVDLDEAQSRAKGFFEEDWYFRLRLEGDKYVCRNWRGDIGLNVITRQELQSTKQGECANLRGWDLQGWDLSGAVLKGAKLNDADLSRADLRGADLTATRINDAKFYEADLRGAVIHRSAAYRAWFRRADLAGAVLTGMDLRLASFVHANLRSANFLDSWVAGTDFNKSVYNRRTLLPFDQEEAALRGMVRSE